MRVLFSATSGDGHVLPLLPLASAFAARGDDVAVATAPGHRGRIEAAGLRHEAAGLDLDELEPRVGPHRKHVATLPIAERREVAFSVRFAEIEAPLKLPPLRALVERWQPDLVVHESADLAAPLAAAAAGIPSVHHSFGRVIPEHALRAAGRLIAPLWEAASVEPDALAGAFRGAYVDICPPCLRAPLGAEPPAVHPLRAVDAPAPGTADGNRPLVYVTLGTIFNRLETFRVVLDALAGVDCDVLMTIGRDRDPADLAPLPANATVVPYLPQAEILPACDLVVAHGGSGSFLAALAHGRPLVLLPHGADQFDNAQACSELGVAMVLLPDELTVETVRAAVRTVLAAPAYTSAARGVAAEIAAMPDAHEVAARLEAWARTSAD